MVVKKLKVESFDFLAVVRVARQKKFGLRVETAHLPD